MKKILLFLSVILTCQLFVFAQSIGIGTNSPNLSAQLDITSNSKGLLIPRMTQAELNAIVSPAQGLMVYNTSTNSFQYYNGSLWLNITHSGIVTGIVNRIPKFSGPWGMNPGMMTDNGNGISINTGGTTADPSAALDVSSTTKGVLVPRMSSVQRTAITTPAAGLLVFDNSTNTFWFYNGTTWAELVAGNGGGPWTANGTAINNTNSGVVGIGTANPDPFYDLDVDGYVRVRADQYINRDLWVDRNLDVDGTSNLFGNIIAGSNISISGNITTVDNVTVTGNVTVDGGKGIVRSNSSSQRVIAFPSGSVSFGNAPAGYSTDVTFALTNVFAANPVICVGNITNAIGPIERWQFTIHAVDIAAHTFLVRMYCPNGSAPVQMTLSFIAIGTAL